MTNGDSKIAEQVRSFVANSGVLDQETEIQNATKFAVKSGTSRAAINVFNTGRIHVEGAETPLKAWCQEVKKAIETGGGGPGIVLPAEIERFPTTLQERVPNCDGVVLWFYQEALRCYKAGSPAAAAFMLGAASEKAILVLIDAYVSRIADAGNRDKLTSRLNSRMISVRYDEFKRSYKSGSPKPVDGIIAQDLEQLLDGAFNFYRHTRNQVGHPQVVPDLDKGVILANIGQFIVYMERIYALMDFFGKNEMKV